jgi:hypothetical protein
MINEKEILGEVIGIDDIESWTLPVRDDEDETKILYASKMDIKNKIEKAISLTSKKYEKNLSKIKGEIERLKDKCNDRYGFFHCYQEKELFNDWVEEIFKNNEEDVSNSGDKKEKGCGKYFGNTSFSMKCGSDFYGNFMLCPECKEKGDEK